MPVERRNLPEQERSIKERKLELFVEKQEVPVPKPPLKPFSVYLRETPATPLSSTVKVILWIVGVVVVILFVAALWRMQRSPRSRPRLRSKPTAAATSPRVTSRSFMIGPRLRSKPTAAATFEQPAPYPHPAGDGTMVPWRA